MSWVLVDAEGGAGNQLIHMVGALIFAISVGRPLVLRHKTVLTFPFDPVISFFEETELLRLGVLPPHHAQNSTNTFTLNAFTPTVIIK